MDKLPPNWTRYTTDDGKEYFHNAVTMTTQWDRPVEDMLPLDGGAAEVFQYKPTATDLESPKRDNPQQDVLLMPMNQQGSAAKISGSNGQEMVDSEMVSLTAAPSGQIGSGNSNNAGGGFGFVGSAVANAAVASVSAMSQGEAGTEIPGIASWMLTYMQRLFDVSTDDVVQRLRLVLLPYPPPPGGGATEDLKIRPDFYGPFWIATTAVLFLAATGNFARLVEVGDHANFKADYGLVSLAAIMIYGCLLAVPLVARVSLFISGEEASNVDFKQIVCVCGYSLAPSIPVSILCVIPLNTIRWLVVLAGLAMSLLFLRGHLWADLVIRTPWLKYILIGTPCLGQVIIFFVYRMHFFNASK